MSPLISWRVRGAPHQPRILTGKAQNGRTFTITSIDTPSGERYFLTEASPVFFHAENINCYVLALYKNPNSFFSRAERVGLPYQVVFPGANHDGCVTYKNMTLAIAAAKQAIYHNQWLITAPAASVSRSLGTTLPRKANNVRPIKACQRDQLTPSS